MACNLDPRVPENLHLWQVSGAAFRWVQAHGGQWNHQDWLDLLASLARTVAGPLDCAAVGLVLERLKAEWWNLRRWQDSGAAWKWVRSLRGQWDHEDWLALLNALSRSDYWPIDAEQVGAVLEEARKRWCNLQRWQESGQATLWVGSHQGQWTHDDWLALLQHLRGTDFWPMNTEALGLLLEVTGSEWRNLRRWEESGQPLRWVESHQGHWDHGDFLTLLGTLQWAEMWPVDVQAVGQALEVTRTAWLNRRRRESGQAPPQGQTPVASCQPPSEQPLVEPQRWFGWPRVNPHTFRQVTVEPGPQSRQAA